MFRKLWIWICCTVWIRKFCSVLHINLPVVILAVGDSLTYGTGANEDKSYPAELEQITGALVINAGVPGEVSMTTCGRINKLLKKYVPHIVLTCIGTNDINSGVSDDWLKFNVTYLCRIIQESGAKQVLIAVPDWRYGIPIQTPVDLRIYQDVGAEQGIPVLPNVLGAVLSNPDLRSDVIHANAAGYKVLADAVAQFLKERQILND